MSITNIRATVERVSYDASQRRQLLLVLGPQEPRLLELSVDDDLVRRDSAMRLTQPGDLVELTVQKSCNGVDGLTAFTNVTLKQRLAGLPTGGAAGA